MNEFERSVAEQVAMMRHKESEVDEDAAWRRVLELRDQERAQKAMNVVQEVGRSAVRMLAEAEVPQAQVVTVRTNGYAHATGMAWHIYTDPWHMPVGLTEGGRLLVGSRVYTRDRINGTEWRGIIDARQITRHTEAADILDGEDFRKGVASLITYGQPYEHASDYAPSRLR